MMDLTTFCMFEGNKNTDPKGGGSLKDNIKPQTSKPFKKPKTEQRKTKSSKDNSSLQCRVLVERPIGHTESIFGVLTLWF